MLSGKPSKILIIDDNPSICRMFKRCLTRNGYEVSTSNNSQEALSLLRSEFFNLVILDIYLPDIDGISMLLKIKSFSSYTEVIMVSGLWNIEDAIQSFKLGASDYLLKPTDPELLVQEVKKALEKQALEFEKRHLIAETNFKNIILESQKDLLEYKVIENDKRIFRLIRRDIFTNKLFEKMLESLPLGVVIIDREGRVLMCNKVQEIFFGISRDSLLGKDLFRDALPMNLEPWREMVKDILSDGSYKIKNFDQRPEKDRILSITLSSLMDEKGRSTSFIFLTADITNEKKNEEQIVQSEKMTAIGQLATNLAHQIRNPLAIIGSATQFCIEKVGSEDGLKKHYEIIYRNVRSADRIISDLLDFAKPKPFEFKKNDINQILLETCGLLKMDFSKSRIRVLRRLDRNLPKIICDRESMKQAFLNLLMNSKQAMPRSGLISISTEYHVKDQFVEIMIEDTGKGIPKKHLPNIFNPYFTTKEKGTGLGLSIAHRIITDHHGRILPESKEGKGTKMTITLPIKSKDF